MKKFYVGIVLTLCYFMGVFFVIVRMDLNKVSSWNELGDFLAGVFSPVAFLWLIVGYLQQQSELSNNTKQLKLQAEELNNSVQQAAELNSLTKQQIEINLKAMKEASDKYRLSILPIINIQGLSFSKSSSGFIVYNIEFKNTGATGKEVVFSSEQFDCSDLGVGIFPSGEVIKRTITTKHREHFYLEVRCDCKNMLGDEYSYIMTSGKK